MIQVLLNMIPAWQFLYSAYDSKTKYINTNNNGDNKNWETTETTAVTDLLVSDSICQPLQFTYFLVCYRINSASNFKHYSEKNRNDRHCATANFVDHELNHIRNLSHHWLCVSATSTHEILHTQYENWGSVIKYFVFTNLILYAKKFLCHPNRVKTEQGGFVLTSDGWVAKEKNNSIQWQKRYNLLQPNNWPTTELISSDINKHV